MNIPQLELRSFPREQYNTPETLQQLRTDYRDALKVMLHLTDAQAEQWLVDHAGYRLNNPLHAGHEKAPRILLMWPGTLSDSINSQLDTYEQEAQQDDQRG